LEEKNFFIIIFKWRFKHFQTPFLLKKTCRNFCKKLNF